MSQYLTPKAPLLPPWEDKPDGYHNQLVFSPIKHDEHCLVDATWSIAKFLGRLETVDDDLFWYSTVLAAFQNGAPEVQLFATQQKIVVIMPKAFGRLKTAIETDLHRSIQLGEWIGGVPPLTLMNLCFPLDSTIDRLSNQLLGRTSREFAIFPWEQTLSPLIKQAKSVAQAILRIIHQQPENIEP